MDPPETRMPSALVGNPTISATQRSASCSTCTAAWSPPQQLLFIPAARKSARMPTGSAVDWMKP